MNKNKTATAIAIILLLTISAVQYEAHAIDIPTFLFASASPNPVGRGQTCYIGAFFSKPPPTTSGWNGDLYENVTVKITDPDGKTTVYGPYTASAAAGVQFSVVFDKVGNYTIQAHYPGEILDGLNPYTTRPGGQMASLRGSKMLPSDSRVVTLVVHEEPVEPFYQTPPLPTEFWTRPIYAANWNWGELGSNWFGIGWYNGYDAIGNVVSSGYAPNTAHIVWTKSTQFGGQPGSPIRSDESTQYSSTSLIQSYFRAVCILNGILYYNIYDGSPNSNMLGWEAIDVHTGEILWSLPAGVTGEESIAWGQIVNYNNYQEFGSNAFLYSQPSAGGAFAFGPNWMGIYDAYTGNFLANVTNTISTSKLIDYESDTQGAIVGYYVSRGNLCMYNYTELICSGGTFIRVSGTINGSNPRCTEWSVPLPTTFNGVSISLSIAAVTPEVILMRQVPEAISWQGSNVGFSYDAGYDAKTGELLWGPINQTGYWNAYEDTSLLCAKDGYYVLHNKDRNLAYGFSLKTGQKLWGPVELEGAAYSAVWRDGEIAYGKVYIWDLGGYVNAIDLETGEIAWTFFRGSSGYDTPFESYPIFGYNVHSIADGKLFLTEGIMYTPPLHPSYRFAINCTDGTLVWKVLQYASTCPGPIADGFLISWNSFDNLIYCFGKGPTAMTVAASPAVSVEGSSVLVTGTVMDKSGGTKQDVITTRFPDGLPAVSDESQEAWMEYAYMQQIKPADVKGVEVTVTVLDPNGNCYNVATATSDAAGFYSGVFTPEVPGKYTIIATFAGSEAYYGSYAETAINVEEAPPATQPPQYPTPIDYTLPIIGTGIAIIIAVAIVGILMLRKK